VRANPTERAAAGFGLPMMVCSTNCLYFSAYLRTAQMLRELGLPGAEAYEKKAQRLREAILSHFWDDKAGSLAYMIDDQAVYRHQEGLGSSFALLFGVLDPAQAGRQLAAQHLTPHGIPCVWPPFERYSTKDGTGFGRHCGTVWPHVNGFWADAAARRGRVDLLMEELIGLASKADRDAQFTEIYHPVTGAIYGGRQEGPHDSRITEWDSCRRQTWSATGFLRMVLHGILGLRFEQNALVFQPQTAAPLTSVALRGLPYRKALLSIEITGPGTRIESFRVNGQSRTEAQIGAEEEGALEVIIQLGS